MCAAAMVVESDRKSLSEAILDELKSWPDLHRQVFVQSHYRGLTPEKVGSCFGLKSPEVRQILNQCERKLRAALREFRRLSSGEPIPRGSRETALAGARYLH